MYWGIYGVYGVGSAAIVLPQEATTGTTIAASSTPKLLDLAPARFLFSIPHLLRLSSRAWIIFGTSARRGAAFSAVADDRCLNQVFSDEMGSLVDENFAGVDAEWWWERRPGGGVAICQELQPAAMVADLTAVSRRDEAEVSRTAVRTLGLQDFEPVVLVFNLDGDTTVHEAAGEMAARSATSEGLAANVYRTLMEALRSTGA